MSKEFQGSKSHSIFEYNTVLTHYDHQLPLKVASDASPYEVGAVLTHVMPDNTERPVAYASRSLHKSEQNYSQLEKEALAIIFSIKKFHQYIYGRKFTLQTDHKPLTVIFGPNSSLPTLAVARIQRWALLLSAYEYNIEYRSSENHGNADALSRLPLPESKSSHAEQSFQATLFNLTQITVLPPTPEQIKKSTEMDPVLSKVLMYLLNGWPEQIDEELKPFYQRRYELGVETVVYFGE